MWTSSQRFNAALGARTNARNSPAARVGLMKIPTPGLVPDSQRDVITPVAGPSLSAGRLPDEAKVGDPGARRPGLLFVRGLAPDFRERRGVPALERGKLEQ